MPEMDPGGGGGACASLLRNWDKNYGKNENNERITSCMN